MGFNGDDEAVVLISKLDKIYDMLDRYHEQMLGVQSAFDELHHTYLLAEHVKGILCNIELLLNDSLVERKDVFCCISRDCDNECGRKITEDLRKHYANVMDESLDFKFGYFCGKP